MIITSGRSQNWANKFGGPRHGFSLSFFFFSNIDIFWGESHSNLHYKTTYFRKLPKISMKNRGNLGGAGVGISEFLPQFEGYKLLEHLHPQPFYLGLY
jgi:hypothetical protein